MEFKGASAAVQAAAAILLLGPAARAETSTDFTYSAPQTGYLTLTAAAFQPESNGYSYVNNGGFLHPQVNGQACFDAPIQLPQGATVNVAKLFYSLVDDQTFTLTILQNRLRDAVQTQPLAKRPPSTAGNYASVEYRTPGLVINNGGYSYFARVCLSEYSAILFDLRLTFTYTSAGD